MKRKLTGSIPAKVTAFVLLVISVWMIVGCTAGAVFCFDQSMYTRSIAAVRDDIWRMQAHSESADILLSCYSPYAERDIEDYCRERNIQVSVTGSDAGETDAEPSPKQSGNLQSYYLFRHENYWDKDYTVEIWVDQTLPYMDQYSASVKLLSTAYSLRYAVFFIALAMVLLFLACMVFLICSAGHRNGQDGLTNGLMVRMPFDLLSAGFFLLLICGFAFAADQLMVGVEETILVLGICGTAAVIFSMLYLMNFAVRIKHHNLWRNTIVYRVLMLFFRGVLCLWKRSSELVHSLPLIWRTIPSAIAVSILGLILVIWSAHPRTEGSLVKLWIIGNILILPHLLFRTLMFHKLQKSVAALADGDLSYQVNTNHMRGEIRRMGEQLNRIGDGMAKAVDERMRSERMKTELITNVSHDIKTPLTSIINYSDLIEKEPTENEKITEYAGVLHRQSARLKKLIDDLVEVSKASTGNLEVTLTPCEVNVLLGQAVGEYEEKLKKVNLTLVTEMPDEPLLILADGRRMWRVLDNLMNNACKYAMPGTRVYLSLVKANSRAVMTFKNISKDALNVKPEELLERFVRGDASRNTEGSGLGLSIARSLTELQGGTLHLDIDGDLFKAELSFDLI